MDPNQEIENLENAARRRRRSDESVSVDDFIQELEAKEKDLHITADTTLIEIDEIVRGRRTARFCEGESSLLQRNRARSDRVDSRLPADASDDAASTEVRRARSNSSERTKSRSSRTERDELLQEIERPSLKDFENYQVPDGPRTPRASSSIRSAISRRRCCRVLDNLNRAIDSRSSMNARRDRRVSAVFRRHRARQPAGERGSWPRWASSRSRRSARRSIRIFTRPSRPRNVRRTCAEHDLGRAAPRLSHRRPGHPPFDGQGRKAADRRLTSLEECRSQLKTTIPKRCCRTPTRHRLRGIRTRALASNRPNNCPPLPTLDILHTRN